MKVLLFNWDKYFSDSSFMKIRSFSPELGKRGLPSCFNPDKTAYYISPLSIAVGTHDIEGLKTQLSRLGELFHSCSDDDYSTRYLAHVDFVQVCLMLLNLLGSDNDYGLPDKVLRSRNYLQEQA